MLGTLPWKLDPGWKVYSGIEGDDSSEIMNVGGINTPCPCPSSCPVTGWGSGSDEGVP
jgi:hypothetical protein